MVNCKKHDCLFPTSWSSLKWNGTSYSHSATVSISAHNLHFTVNSWYICSFSNEVLVWRATGRRELWLDAWDLTVIKLALISYSIQLRRVDLIVFPIQSTCFQPWSRLSEPTDRWKPSDSLQPLGWPDHLQGIHMHVCACVCMYVSAYTAVCMPKANRLLHAQSHRLSSFYFRARHNFTRLFWAWLDNPFQGKCPRTSGATASFPKTIRSPRKKYKRLKWRDLQHFGVFSEFCRKTVFLKAIEKTDRWSTS